MKSKRKTTASDRARIKTLEDRLDAAVAESQRMRWELALIQGPDDTAQRITPTKPSRRRMTTMDTYSTDDTVN